MRTFQDSRKNTWRISLPIGTVLRVKGESAGRFNLFEPSSLVDGQQLATAIQFDIPLFWEMLAYLVAPQLRKRKVSAKQFGKWMKMANCRDAREAFQAEWLDFFRDGNRPDLAAVVGRAIAMREQIQATIEKQIQTEKELDAPIIESLSQRLTNTFGDWQGSWNATPGDIPGVN